MASTPKRVKHYVLVARPRIETAIVEVDATHDADAEQQALAKAATLPAAAWSPRRYDPSAYRPHVETMIAEDELEGQRARDCKHAAELLTEFETRYLLLMAKEDSEAGHLLLQPWFITDEPDLMASDLTRDWLASLQRLGLTHMSERLDDLAAGSTPTPSDRVLFGARTPKTRKE
jgi:hypothetical protein